MLANSFPRITAEWLYYHFIGQRIKNPWAFVHSMLFCPVWHRLWWMKRVPDPRILRQSSHTTTNWGAGFTKLFAHCSSFFSLPNSSGKGRTLLTKVLALRTLLTAQLKALTLKSVLTLLGFFLSNIERPDYLGSLRLREILDFVSDCHQIRSTLC